MVGGGVVGGGVVGGGVVGGGVVGGGDFGFVEVGAGRGGTTVIDLDGAGLCDGDADGVGLGELAGVCAAGLG